MREGRASAIPGAGPGSSSGRAPGTLGLQRAGSESEMLREACEMGLKTLRAARSDVKRPAPVLKSAWLADAISVQFSSTSKYACGASWCQTSGFVITRIPHNDPGIVEWSAPCFLRGQLAGAGPLFGALQTETVTLGMTPVLARRLATRGKRVSAGMDWQFVPGSSTAVHSDIITAPSSTWGIVGVDAARGVLMGAALFVGVIHVDLEKNAALYGPASTSDVLSGAVEAPEELAPLYAELRRICIDQANDGGGVPQTGRDALRVLSAVDPDAHITLSDGEVIAGTDLESVSPAGRRLLSLGRSYKHAVVESIERGGV